MQLRKLLSATGQERNKKECCRNMKQIFKAWKKSMDFDIDNGWILFHKINSNILSIWGFEIDVMYQKIILDF